MNSIRLITSIVIIAFLCQNIAWAGGNNCLAQSSKAAGLIPRYSKAEAVREASRSIETILISRYSGTQDKDIDRV